MENVLTIKYGNRFVQGIDNIDIRLEIESEAFNDVRDYIELKKIQNLDYQYMNEYVQIVFAEAMGLGILEFLLRIRMLMKSSYRNMIIFKLKFMGF